MTKKISTVSFKKRLKEYVDNSSKFEWNIHDHLKGLDIETLKNIQKCNSKNIDLMILNVEGDLNVGVMIRTASLLGFNNIHIIGRPRYDRRSTVGAHVYLNINTEYCINNTSVDIDYDKVFNYIITKNLFPIICEQGGLELNSNNRKYISENILSKITEGKTPCVIVGNESTGIPKTFIEKFKKNEVLFISIPQKGIIRSFNVSSAFAIVGWEISNLI